MLSQNSLLFMLKKFIKRSNGLYKWILKAIQLHELKNKRYKNMKKNVESILNQVTNRIQSNM